MFAWWYDGDIVEGNYYADIEVVEKNVTKLPYND